MTHKPLFFVGNIDEKPRNLAQTSASLISVCLTPSRIVPQVQVEVIETQSTTNQQLETITESST